MITPNAVEKERERGLEGGEGESWRENVEREASGEETRRAYTATNDE